jgi:Uma2 family endonuclease
MTAEEYDRTAAEYLARLPLEHFMEATPQSTQREISTASFALLRKARADFCYFSELLVQYFHEGNLRQVVPDNMVVLGTLTDKRRSNYATELEPFPLFWTLEYVSATNQRKDYVDSFQKYEQELQIPYYLTFAPDDQDLRLHRHDGVCYVLVQANQKRRYPLAEVELEVGLLDGWVRYWYRGELLPIPVELQDQIQQLRQQLQERERQMEAVASMLRPLVEVRARQAGRQDILERLPATTDNTLLTRWLTELG